MAETEDQTPQIMDDTTITATTSATETNATATTSATETNTTINSQLIDILKGINWQRFATLCSSLGNELNDQQWRFLKAVFLENAVAEYSNGMLVYVGDEKNGCDFVVPSLNNVKIEMKYTTEALYSGKKTTIRDKCKNITLLNSKGTNTHSNLPDSYADYLLIVETRGAALVSKETLKKYVVSNGDSLSAIVPTSELNIIFEPSDIIITEKQNLKIKERFMSVITEIINSIE